MITLKQLLPLSLCILVLLGCNKEDENPVDSYVPNIAPCTVSEQQLVIEEIIYGPSAKFPNATLRITFENTSLEYAFNKVPATGMYHMVPNIDPSYLYDNQMATVQDSGSFLSYSSITQTPEVYIENYNNELIISYCGIENNTAIFDGTNNIYLHNKPSSLNVRMSY